MISPAKLRVLIAEDDILVSGMLQLSLETGNYTVIGEASDGQMIINLTQELRPDVILMDIAMPVLSGLEAAEIIQHLCPTPIVMVTAFNNPDLIARASAAGVHSYLVKPIRLQDLDHAITTALARFHGE